MRASAIAFDFLLAFGRTNTPMMQDVRLVCTRRRHTRSHRALWIQPRGRDADNIHFRGGVLRRAAVLGAAVRVRRTQAGICRQLRGIHGFSGRERVGTQYCLCPCVPLPRRCVRGCAVGKQRVRKLFVRGCAALGEDEDEDMPTPESSRARPLEVF